MLTPGMAGILIPMDIERTRIGGIILTAGVGLVVMVRAMMIAANKVLMFLNWTTRISYI